MPPPKRHPASALRDGAALVATLVAYWLRVYPRVRAELARWRATAAAIPDPGLRALALDTLETEDGLAEGAAIFATLAPPRRRGDLVAAHVAWQVAYDYLDTLGEQLVDEHPDRCPELYASLLTPLTTNPTMPRIHLVEDGGYLLALLETCHDGLRSQPGAPVVLPHAHRAAARCAEGQTLTHAAKNDGAQRLAEWASAQHDGEGWNWWELAAGSISSLAVHALFAAAADDRATAAAAAAIDAAYYPSICALSTLFDSAVDGEVDAGGENHRPSDRYASQTDAIARTVQVARESAAQARRLSRGRRHVAILAGMISYYVLAATDDTGRETTRAAAATVTASVAPIIATLELRRRRKHPTPGAETGSPTRAGLRPDTAHTAG